MKYRVQFVVPNGPTSSRDVTFVINAPTARVATLRAFEQLLDVTQDLEAPRDDLEPICTLQGVTEIAGKRKPETREAAQ